MFSWNAPENGIGSFGDGATGGYVTVDNLPRYLPLADCGFLDGGCGISGMMVQTFWGFKVEQAALISNVFSAAVSATSATEERFDIAFTAAGDWLGIAFILLLIVFAVAISIYALKGRKEEILKSVIGAVFAYPLMSALLFLVRTLSDAFQSISAGLYESGIQTMVLGPHFGDFRGLLEPPEKIPNPTPDPGFGDWEPFVWPKENPEGKYLQWTEGAHEQYENTEVFGAMISSLLMDNFMMLFLLFLSLALALMLAFRTAGLLIGVLLAPMGVLFIGQPFFGSMFRKWAQFMIGLLLGQPIALGVMSLGMALFGHSPDFVGKLMGIVITTIAAVSPLMVLRLVNFLGDDLAKGTPALSQVSQVTRSVTSPIKRLGRK